MNPETIVEMMRDVVENDLTCAADLLRWCENSGHLGLIGPDEVDAINRWNLRPVSVDDLHRCVTEVLTGNYKITGITIAPRHEMDGVGPRELEIGCHETLTTVGRESEMGFHREEIEFRLDAEFLPYLLKTLALD